MEFANPVEKPLSGQKNAWKGGEVEMKELIIKVDDPNERAWDGSSKVFEIKELVRCKDCKLRDPEDKKCDSGHGILWQLPRDDNWFCADGERES